MESAAGQPRRPAGLWLFAFYSSLLLNVLIFAHYFLWPTASLGDGRAGAGGDGYDLSWSLQAAKEAEAVAATDCSGHGQVFLDGITGESGRPGCECNRCFGGLDCSIRIGNCSANAVSGNPLFLEPYWRQNAAAGAVVLSPWHRLGYISTDGGYQSLELERLIRRLHRAVGNAVVDDKQVVFGTGSIQLVNALLHALSPGATSTAPPARVVAAMPYYEAYRTQTTMFDGREYRWDGTTAKWANASRDATDGFIELVTSPNNPDTMLNKRVLRGSAAIVDHAYYWPHFTQIPALADEDVMLFTASKLSGHAGSRFGWALIRDKKVAERARDYVEESTMGTSRDSHLRMLVIMKAVLANLHGKDIFAFGHDVMRSRWRRLSAVVSRSRRFSLQEIPPQYCTYFNRTREPSPAYAWVKCERKEDEDCHQVLLKAKIITRSGVGSEAGSRYTRVSLLKTDDDFDMLLERITDLVNSEENNATTWSSM